MRTRHATIGAVVHTSRLVTEAAERGLVPPYVLTGSSGTVHAWALLDGCGNDSLFVDEYGDLWWARPSAVHTATSVRRLWPEEERSLAAAIGARIEQILLRS